MIQSLQDFLRYVAGATNYEQQRNFRHDRQNFDLERLAAHLPAGLAAELSAAAAAVEPGPDATEAVRSLRGRLLDGLTRSAGG